MSDLFTLVCQGTVSVLADGSPSCSGMWVLAQMPEPFSIEMLEPTALAQAFATGFIPVAVVSCIGIAARALLDAIKGR